VTVTQPPAVAFCFADNGLDAGKVQVPGYLVEKRGDLFLGHRLSSV
jgi:hypothetical protein